jgi:uroporphyrinogen-III decarboxylase
MDRTFFLGLAAAGLRMPIGTHLVLQEHPDPAAVVLDGRGLGRVVEEAARRFRTPLALPLMDLKLEKESLLLARGVAPAAVDTHHFTELPAARADFRLTARMAAACGGIRYIATETDLVPVGMAIGPFSLMTKLLADPISPVFLAGTGATAADEPEVALIEAALEIAFQTIQQYLDAQMTAGARAVILCEPAANKVYFSPNQLAASYDIFDRYVMKYNLALRDQLAARGVDLIFHDCGELLDGMVRRFARLDPAMLSLGSSRRLWEDAALLPKNIVLYGNLPTKQFYSDELLPVEKVRQLAADLARHMSEADHPFILGSECDVLSVPGREAAIKQKVAAFLDAA